MIPAEVYRDYCTRYGLEAVDMREHRDALPVIAPEEHAPYVLSVVYDMDTENYWAIGRAIGAAPDSEPVFRHPVPCGLLGFLDDLRLPSAQVWVRSLVLNALEEYGYFWA